MQSDTPAQVVSGESRSLIEANKFAQFVETVRQNPNWREEAKQAWKSAGSDSLDALAEVVRAEEMYEVERRSLPRAHLFCGLLPLNSHELAVPSVVGREANGRT